MAGHVANVTTTLKAGKIKSVPGLEARLKEADEEFDVNDPATYPQAWSCANTCNDVKLFGVSFMVDFVAKTIIEDPNAKPCDRATPAAGGAGASASSSDKPRIRHGKVEVNGVFAEFKLDASFGRPPQAGVFDEAVVAALPSDRVILLMSPEKVPPSSFITHLRTLAIQIGSVIAANSSAIATTMVAKRSARVEAAKGLNSLIHAGASSRSEFTLDIPNKNNITLICIQRGVLEIADYSTLVHRTHYSTVNFHEFMAQLFEKYRPDLADILEILDDADALVADISARLDNNIFYVLGARLLAGQKAPLHAFFRRERPRYEEIAKKMGWKPSASPKKPAPQSPKTPTPTRPSLSGNKRDRDADTDADADVDADQPPKQDRRDHKRQGGPRRRGKGGKPKGGKGGGGGGGAAGASTTFSR